MKEYWDKFMNLDSRPKMFVTAVAVVLFFIVLSIFI